MPTSNSSTITKLAFHLRRNAQPFGRGWTVLREDITEHWGKLFPGAAAPAMLNMMVTVSNVQAMANGWIVAHFELQIDGMTYGGALPAQIYVGAEHPYPSAVLHFPCLSDRFPYSGVYSLIIEGGPFEVEN